MPYEFFTEKELTCKCGCGKQLMKDDFMAKVIELRRKCGFPFSVSSAYRCPAHNNRVSSSGLTGAHTTGRAIDIAVQGKQALILLKEAAAMSFTGIGVNQKGGGRFIHLDDLPPNWGPRPNVWSY